MLNVLGGMPYKSPLARGKLWTSYRSLDALHGHEITGLDSVGAIPDLLGLRPHGALEFRSSEGGCGLKFPNLGDAQEFKGYIFKIKGGQDKQGFPMKQGVLTPNRVRVLMSPGDQCFRGYGRRDGERRRKSVRGCIVSHDLSVLNLVIVKKGEKELPGLTDEEKPRQRGPKRASKIRKLFNLTKDDDVRQYAKIYGKKITRKNGRETIRAPKVQRLVTPLTLQRKRARAAHKRQRIEKKKTEAAEYHKLLVSRVKEERERRCERGMRSPSPQKPGRSA